MVVVADLVLFYFMLGPRIFNDLWFMITVTGNGYRILGMMK